MMRIRFAPSLRRAYPERVVAAPGQNCAVHRNVAARPDGEKLPNDRDDRRRHDEAKLKAAASLIFLSLPFSTLWIHTLCHKPEIEYTRRFTNHLT